MRPQNQVARDQLTTVLRRQPGASASDLAAALGVSVPTLHRMFAEARDQVLSTGRARRTRYALRRGLRGDLTPLPLYAIDVHGHAYPLSELSLLQPGGSCMPMTDTGWPVPEESRDGWWDGLPYPFNDMRAQGYMGRQWARAQHRRLGVPADPREWSDDDVIWALSRSGSDTSGNWIVGNPAFEQWQTAKLAGHEPLRNRVLGPAYVRMAGQAVDLGVAGSSAAGEFPKFSAQRELAGAGTPQVLVKFSGAGSSPAVRRWSDLLVTEHLALETVAELAGIASSRTRIVAHAGRTFLEVERFDRHGAFGRSPLVSLATLDAAFIGAGTSDWTTLAGRLAAQSLLDDADVERVRHLWWFGKLIANSDMHTGNLSFVPHDRSLTPAPAYDMLPMHYAPLPGGEVPTRSFEPALPLPSDRSVWLAACAAAISFWDRASADTRIGASFRRICRANGVRLRDLADRV